MSGDTSNSPENARNRFIVARHVQGGIRSPVLHGDSAFYKEDAMRRAEELNHGTWPLGDSGWGVYSVREAGNRIADSVRTFLGGGSYAIGNPTAYGGFYLHKKDGAVPVFGWRSQVEKAAARSDLRVLVLTPVF
ncbi:MAG: hypothetical protein HY362_03250 [Candidatus Aenigmarchaeota archaeon]|nr:hypothetical protein [Candidatus Aenigmarchaeota archaeon]